MSDLKKKKNHLFFPKSKFKNFFFFIRNCFLLKKDYFMQNGMKQQKERQRKPKNYVQKRREFINIGRDSLDVSTQARDQSNKVPTNESRN